MTNDDNDPAYRATMSAWSDAEKFVWERARLGEVADFNASLGTTLSPDDPTGMGQDRLLSAAFLEDVLTLETLRSRMSRHGLRIAGALVQEHLNLAEASLAHSLRIEQSRIVAGANLTGVRTSRTISFDASVFVQALLLVNGRIDASLSLRGAKLYQTLDGRSVKVSGDLELKGIRYTRINLSGAVIDGSCDFGKSICSTRHGPWRRVADLTSEGIRLESAKVKGDLVLDESFGLAFWANHAVVSGRLQANDASFARACEMQGMHVGSDFLATDSKFREIDLTDANVGGQLILDGTRCACLQLQFASVASDLIASGSVRLGEVHAPGAKIGGDFILDDAQLYRSVELIDAKVGLGIRMSRVRARRFLNLERIDCGGKLDFAGSNFGGYLSLRSARIGAMLTITGGSRFRDIDLMWARVGGLVNFSDATVTGVLNMQAINVGQSIYLRAEPTSDPCQFNRLDLQDAVVRNTVFARRAHFSGVVEMSSLEVGYLWLKNSEFSADVRLQSVTVTHDLDLSDTRFTKLLNLTGATIKGALEFGSSTGGGPTWGADGKLSLRDASADVVRDRAPTTKYADLGPWPKQMDLSGFTYSRLGGHTEIAATGGHLSDREVRWYLDWLSCNVSFSHQPYQQLANALVKQGEPQKANDVRYAAREAHRKSTRGWQWAGLTLLKMTIGYGIGARYFRSVGWALVLGLMGAVIFQNAVPEKLPTFGLACLFSLDQLLPVVKLLAGADDIAKKISGVPLIYLAIHRTLGFMLSSFVVAGLSGITQK